MFRYVVEGNVRPETQSFPNYYDELDTNEAGLKLQFKLKLSILNGKITSEVISQNEILDLFVLRNVVYDIISLVVNIQGYLCGCYYDVEIISLFDEKNNVKGNFTSVFEDLDKDSTNRATQDPKRIQSLFIDAKYNYLRSALSDLGLAIKHAKDSGFYCFRSIESLRKYFDEINDANSWQLLRTNLNISRWFIESIKQFADQPRHGDFTNATSLDRSNTIRNTWKIVDRFIIYALNGCKPLDKTAYPEL